MKQFSVYQLEKRLVVTLQCSYVELSSTVCALLVPTDRAEPIDNLMPAVKLNNRNYVVDIPNLSAIRTVRLKKPVGDLNKYHQELKLALDFLFTGF